MAEKHKVGKDGILKDGVSHYPADSHDLESYRDALAQLGETEIPVFIHADNPNERLFAANFDGTGNDARNNPEHSTNVAWIHGQIQRQYEAGHKQIASGYVEGPGTQKNFFVRTWDGARGHTYDERLERMYQQFIDQAKVWRDQNPNAQIRLADIGFSRGAEQAIGFSRLVHERGIQDPSGATYARDRDGDIVGVTYTKPPLVAPGKTAQVAVLFDPVGTGEPIQKHDRRPPPSVLHVYQLTAEDERRIHFRSTQIVDLGRSEDGRSMNSMVGGAHSNLGGGYHRDGLSTRAGNLGAIYINGLSDTPFLNLRPESDDPRLNVVHHSEKGMLLYRFAPKVDRHLPEGRIERLVPEGQLKHVADGYNPEPRDEALASQFEFRKIPIGSMPDAPKTPRSHDDPAAVVSRLLAAAASGDNAAFREATRNATDHDAARALRDHAVATVDQQQAATQQQAVQQPDLQQHEAPVRRQAVPMH